MIDELAVWLGMGAILLTIFVAVATVFLTCFWGWCRLTRRNPVRALDKLFRALGV